MSARLMAGGQPASPDQAVVNEPATKKPKRQGLSKRVRFEVFKRDLFTCQYCGAHPPGVLLHADHVIAVAAGGANTIDNLVTACEPCNLGKGARSLNVVPATLATKAALVEEHEAQIRGYQQILEAKRTRIEDELWRVAEIISPGCSELGMKRDWTGSIQRFNAKLGVHAVMDLAEVAYDRYPSGGKSTFLYFCGCCWNEIRKLDGEEK